MKGWVGLVGWSVADGLPTLVVTHQLQVERRTGKVYQSETDVLPLCHATNYSERREEKKPGRNVLSNRVTDNDSLRQWTKEYHFSALTLLVAWPESYPVPAAPNFHKICLGDFSQVLHFPCWTKPGVSPAKKIRGILLFQDWSCKCVLCSTGPLQITATSNHVLTSTKHGWLREDFHMPLLHTCCINDAYN